MRRTTGRLNTDRLDTLLLSLTLSFSKAREGILGSGTRKSNDEERMKGEEGDVGGFAYNGEEK